MTNHLSLDWIISTLKKSGINSKQVVIDRLEKASNGKLRYLSNDIWNVALDKNESKLDPRD